MEGSWTYNCGKKKKKGDISWLQAPTSLSEQFEILNKMNHQGLIASQLHQLYRQISVCRQKFQPKGYLTAWFYTDEWIIQNKSKNKKEQDKFTKKNKIK